MEQPSGGAIITEMVAVRADSREVLLAYVLEGKRDLERESPGIRVDPVLRVSFIPCGGRISYHTLEDIPSEDVPCSCGDPKHWLIKYGT